MTLKKSLILLLFFVLIAPYIQSEWKISREELENRKINYRNLEFAILSPKGDYAIGYSFYSDIEHKKRGEIYCLHIFKFGKNGKIDIKEVPLKINVLIGIALNDKDKTIVVVGNYGSIILTVDLKTYRVTKVFEYRKNIAGFRTETLVVQWNNRIYLTGYFYDKEQYWEGDYLVELILPNEAKKQALEFRKKVDLRKVYDELKAQPIIMQVISDKMIYFVIRATDANKKPIQKLMCYNNGKVQEVERGLGIGNFAGTEKKIYASILTKDKTWDTYIKNVNNTGKVSLGEPNICYTYPFISENAKTAMFCSVNYFNQTMNIYYAQEKDKYQKKVLYENVPMGLLKISATGNAYLRHAPDGVEVDTFDGLEARQKKEAEEDIELEDLKLD